MLKVKYHNDRRGAIGAVLNIHNVLKAIPKILLFVSAQHNYKQLTQNRNI